MLFDVCYEPKTCLQFRKWCSATTAQQKISLCLYWLINIRLAKIWDKKHMQWGWLSLDMQVILQTTNLTTHLPPVMEHITICGIYLRCFDHVLQTKLWFHSSYVYEASPHKSCWAHLKTWHKFERLCYLFKEICSLKQLYFNSDLIFFIIILF